MGMPQQVSPLVSLENADIFQASLVGATVIIVYLFREVRFWYRATAYISVWLSVHIILPKFR